MNRERREALHLALLSALTSQAELEQMLSFGMGVRLVDIASGNLRDQVFAVINYAEAHGLLEQLLASALKAYAGNPALRAFAADPDRFGAGRSEPPRVAAAAVDKQVLRNVLEAAFTLEDLDVLCSDLADQHLQPPVGQGTLSLEDIAGATKQSKIVNLIRYFEHRQLLDALVDAVRTQRPGRL